MGEITEVINVTVDVKDARITQAGFGVPLILDVIPDTVFSNRVKSYATIDDVVVDFPTATKVYKAASALFSQSHSPEKIKVGREDSADSGDPTTALTAIEAEDADWYCLIATHKSSGDIQEIAGWIKTRAKIFLASSEDVDVLDGADSSDIASWLKNNSHNRTAYMWHHMAGVDVAITGINVTSEVAKVAATTHGLQVGDSFTMSGVIDAGSYPDALNGEFTVTAETTDDFDYDAPNSTASPDTSDAVCYLRTTFPEAAWAGLQLPTAPGASSWYGKALSGISKPSKTVLSSSAEGVALGKNANIYSEIAGIGFTRNGMMASGRFIDIQRGIDWLESRIGERILKRIADSAKIPYTDAGAAIIEAEIAAQLNEGVRAGLLGPLLDSEAGEYYRITVPKVADQNPNDRTARYFPGITAQAQLAGAIHKLNITVNAGV